ncbi:MAG TPA: hypothetical protein VGM99_04260, partial [Candidatus Cybelea sp.]
ASPVFEPASDAYAKAARWHQVITPESSCAAAAAEHCFWKDSGVSLPNARAESERRLTVRIMLACFTVLAG